MTSSDGRCGWRRWLAVGAGTIVGLVVAAIAAWVLLLPDVQATPLASVVDDPALAVTVDDGGATVAPAAGPVSGTVVFYPGAGVPPAAYLPTWAPIVEATSFRVVVPAMPLGLAVLDSDAAAEVRTRAGADGGPWWIGGHSLGGAMAASHLADTEPGTWDGLVLWAAYPAGEGLADRDDLEVVSVAGTRDRLTTPDEVEASRDDLPPDATFRVLDGVNHAQFGAYGDQRGDGLATVDDDDARALIAAATADALDD